jgi:hypothetical protein
MLGDAIDFLNLTCPQKNTTCSLAGIEEWQNTVKATGGILSTSNPSAAVALTNKGGLSQRLFPDGAACGYHCTHSDWRENGYGKYDH